MAKSNKVYERTADFERFWALYPRREAVRAACKAFHQALARDGVTPEAIIAGAERYRAWVKATERQFIKHASTWLNGDCWEDDLPIPKPKSPTPTDSLLEAYRATLQPGEAFVFSKYAEWKKGRTAQANEPRQPYRDH